MIKKTIYIILLVAVILSIASCKSTKENPSSKEGFVKVFNGENWDGLYLKLRKDDDALAKRVFAIDNEMVHAFKDMPDSLDLGTGENDTHGLFYTKKKYSKYILRFEYKWGDKIANNFDEWQYDAGVYYHVIDDKVWPTGIEYQIRYNHITDRNHTGDLIRPGGVDYDWYSTTTGDDKTFLSPKDGGKIEETKKAWLHYAKPTTNHNALNDKWNKCEIIVMGDKYTIHKLNGDIVNMAYNLAPNKGIIGFQAETAEILYRNIEIKEFDEIPPIETFTGN